MRIGFVRLFRFVIYGCASILLILIVLSVAVRVQNWVFRNRAEALFNSVQSIDTSHATFQEVASTFKHWDASGGFVDHCSEKQCDFGIAIGEPIIGRKYLEKIITLLPFYRLLGGHPAIARAIVIFRNGFVQAKRYGLAIEAPPFIDADGRPLTYYVEGNISTESDANPSNLVRPTLDRHPEYQIGSNACLGCVEIHVKFTPYAASTDIQRLSQINFSCLTRRHPCRTEADIMPIAVSEHLAELRSSNSPRQHYGSRGEE
jgi:hypothetical protein